MAHRFHYRRCSTTVSSTPELAQGKAKNIHLFPSINTCIINNCPHGNYFVLEGNFPIVLNFSPKFLDVLFRFGNDHRFLDLDDETLSG